MKDQRLFSAKVYSYLYIYKLFFEKLHFSSKYYVILFGPEGNRFWRSAGILKVYLVGLGGGGA